MRTLSRSLLITLGLVLVIAIGVWTQRKPIASDAIDRELTRRGVPASYRVTRIGVRWQRIENVRLGNPALPDLTADWAEVRLSAGFGGVGVTAIRAGGVRLRGRLLDGTLRLGVLDKLLPPPSGKPFALPDLDVDLADARMRLDTPYGAIGLRLDGSGNLADGFRGKLAALAPRLGQGDCIAERATAYLDLRVADAEPTVEGPVRAVSMRCEALVSSPAVALSATLGAALSDWRGSARIEAAGVDSVARLGGVTGNIDFAGNSAATTGQVRLAASRGSLSATRFGAGVAEGRYRLGSTSAFDGRISVSRVAVDPVLADTLRSAARDAGGTPVAPLLAKLGDVVAQAGRDLSGEASLVVTSNARSTSAHVRRLVATAAGGAALRVEGGDGIRFGGSGLTADTRLRVAGGGFPEIDASLMRLASGETRGVARFAPYAAEQARIVLAPVRYAATPTGAMRIETVATLDGPLGDGRVAGLRMPVSLLVGSRGSIAVNRGCSPVEWRAVSVSGLTLDAARLRLCAVGEALLRTGPGGLQGGASMAAARLTGQLGATPLTLAATDARFSLGANGFSADGLTARLGSGERVRRLDIGRLDGRIAGGAVVGQFAETAGQIGQVPLLIGGGAGDWALRGGVLTLGGGVTVSDAAADPRFAPLAGDAVKLRLADGRVTVIGALREPASRILVANIDIAHDLAAGTGRALLDVPGVAFGRALQPEALTRLTVGVIANVEGSVAGTGIVRWTPQGVSSSGRFGTQGLDLAAAFGPVTGLKGALDFTDLLALETAPGQRVTIGSINPGISVTGGVIEFRLLRDQRLAITSGRWPFAGGALILEPSTLDLGQPVARRLTFRIDGLDAAKFIQQLEFENLAATGIFDGTLPMVFDETGGRIVDGSLAARAGGGTVAYVGDVTNANLPIYGKLAFDALKALRYRNLGIALDGALDGEIVAQVNFNGVNARPVEPTDSFIVRRFIGLPFIFNITIRAPFRGLLASARGFQDPGLLIRRADLPVQPIESEDGP